MRRSGPITRPAIRDCSAVPSRNATSRSCPGPSSSRPRRSRLEPRQADGTAFDAAAIGDRSVFLPADHDYRDVPIYWRPDLAAGASFQGPALVAEPQTTTFVTAAFTGRIDSKSNLVLEKV
ncbi:hypothetical protein [Ponticoccus litoralis]|uniref:Acetophenone carboxylase-like C-terminal domain-containing protein n=1 Tax=Ponticoccus litoralis TaxID=422297 RepID=A0AAW9STV3_9RHOB